MRNSSDSPIFIPFFFCLPNYTHITNQFSIILPVDSAGFDDHLLMYGVLHETSALGVGLSVCRCVGVVTNETQFANNFDYSALLLYRRALAFIFSVWNGKRHNSRLLYELHRQLLLLFDSFLQSYYFVFLLIFAR